MKFSISCREQRSEWQDLQSEHFPRYCRSRDISVGIATMLRAGGQGLDSRQVLQNFLLIVSRPTLGPIHLPI
jgi:hypothetical protein